MGKPRKTTQKQGATNNGTEKPKGKRRSKARQLTTQAGDEKAGPRGEVSDGDGDEDGGG